MAFVKTNEEAPEQLVISLEVNVLKIERHEASDMLTQVVECGTCDDVVWKLSKQPQALFCNDKKELR